MQKTSLGFNIHNKPSATNDEDVNVDEFFIDNFVLADELISELQIEQQTQNTDIEALETSISEINEKNDTQDLELAKLQQENIELKKTQDDMIEKSLNKETEADTSLIVKDTDEWYGKLSIFGGQRQEKRETSRNICQSQANFWELGMYNSEAGQKVAHNSRARCKDLTAVAANTEIYFNTFNDEYSFVIRTYDENKAFINSIGEKINGTKLLLADNIKYISNTIMRKGASGNLEEGQIILDKIKNGEIKPFICLSSETNKEFEEYGVKPSLYDTAEVECVGDNVQLFKSIDTATRSGITFANNGDGSYTLNGTSTKDTSFYVTNLGYEAGTYTLSANNSIANSSVAMQLETSGGNKRFALSDINSHKTYEVDDINVLSIIVASGTTLNDYVICPKLEKGSKATSLSKFGQGSVEITTSNKNLYDTTKFVQGTWNANGNTRVVAWLGKIEKGQKIVTKRNNAYEYLLGITTMNYRDIDNVLLYNDGWRTTEKSEMTATVNGYLFLQIRKNDNSNITSVELLTDDFQVEFDEETDFAEHRGKTHIMPIQQKMFEGDGFERIDGVWCEKHDKGEYVMDGVNNKFTYFNNTNNSLKIEIEDSIKSNGYFEAQKNLFLMCTHFIQGNTQAYFQSGMVVYWDVQGALYVKFEEGEFTGLTQANDWLKEQYDAGTPVIIAYQRVTPKLLKCTAEQSKILDKIDTYKNGTIITTDNDLCKIKLRYKQSLEAAIKEYTATTVAESEE